MKKQLPFLIIFFAIIALSFCLRVYLLGSIPSPELDEVSNGYNAYSLLKTGSDEYGKHLPLLLQAYNDFRPAIFVYATIPFVWLFGLTVFAIRLPSVILGVLTTACLFFLGKGVFGKDKQRTFGFFDLSTITGLILSFFYAISPWNLYSSRLSNEVNMSLSFFVFGLTCFIYSLREGMKTRTRWPLFLFAVIFWVVSFYSYHGVKLFFPFFLIGLIVIYAKDLWIQKKMVIVGGMLGIVLLIPLFIAFSDPQTRVRLGAVSIVTQNPQIITQSSDRILYDTSHQDSLGAIFDNRRILLFYQFMQNYLRNFDPTWLFLAQENKSFGIPDFGPFYLFELPLLLLGIYALIKKTWVNRNIPWLVGLWVFASIMPSALSGESPHLNRTNTLLPAFLFLTALGISFLLYHTTKIKQLVCRYAIYGIILLVIGFSFCALCHDYFVNFSYMNDKAFQGGVLEAFAYTKAHESGVDKIVVANDNNLLESYMYYLFANSYDPRTYQHHGGTGSGFFTDNHTIGKYYFMDFNLMKPRDVVRSMKPGASILYVTNPGQLSSEIQDTQHVHLIKTFFYKDGRDAILIWQGTL